MSGSSLVGWTGGFVVQRCFYPTPQLRLQGMVCRAVQSVNGDGPSLPGQDGHHTADGDVLDLEVCDVNSSDRVRRLSGLRAQCLDVFLELHQVGLLLFSSYTGAAVLEDCLVLVGPSRSPASFVLVDNSPASYWVAALSLSLP